MITINGKQTEYCKGMMLGHIALNADTAVVNSVAVKEDWDKFQIFDGDTVICFNKSQLPSESQLEALMVARHSPKIHQKLKKSKVAIAGLGGLGSNVANLLARMGVGKLLLIDFDIVEPTNLNRQQYLISQLGMNKTDATRENLAAINPYIELEMLNVKLDSKNIAVIFSGYDIVAECLDDATAKQMLVETLLTKTTVKTIVAASGMAGLGDSNSITTKQITDRLILVGDTKSAAQPSRGLMATRVAVAAAHQANAIVEKIVKEK